MSTCSVGLNKTFDMLQYLKPFVDTAQELVNINWADDISSRTFLGNTRVDSAVCFGVKTANF